MSKTNLQKLVLVGRITKAHGVKGEVGITLFAESPDILRGEVFLQKGVSAVPEPLRVASIRGHHGNLLVHFEGVKDRNQAELLRGAEILILRQKLPELDEEEAYLADMLGLAVFVKQDGSPSFLGHIENIDAPAGQELWSITTQKGEEVLLPAVPEFIIDIDLEKGEVLIAPPLGLLELYLDKKA